MDSVDPWRRSYDCSRNLSMWTENRTIINRHGVKGKTMQVSHTALDIGENSYDLDNCTIAVAVAATAS